MPSLSPVRSKIKNFKIFISMRAMFRNIESKTSLIIKLSEQKFAKLRITGKISDVVTD